MNKPLALVGALAMMIIVAMCYMLTPSEAGPLGIFVFFVLCYAFFLGLAVHICKLFFILYNKAKKGRISNIDKKSVRYGSVLALAPELAIILKSGGTLGVWQILAIIFFELLLFFYVAHTRL